MELTRKDKVIGNTVKLVWIANCDKALEEIKNSLYTTASRLEQRIFWTDASQVGFGAVLEQQNSEGVRLPVAFASKPTNQAEVKYGVTELEVAALIFARHFAPKKLYKRVSQQYYWPRMRDDIYQNCQLCATCASAQGQKRQQTPPLQSIPVGEPFEYLGMDFKKMNVSNQGNRYALVLQDCLTKWPEVCICCTR